MKKLNERNKDFQNDASELDELELKEIVQRKIDFFKVNPDNKVFDSLKDETYWKNLRKDIEENKGIENPLIAFANGTLIEGHSRISVLRELVSKGKIPLDYKVPTIIFKGTQEEGSRRLILGNLNRFEIDPDTRTLLFAKLYPGYFAPNYNIKEGGAHGAPPPTRKQVSDDMGVSESQAKREKALVQGAIKETGKSVKELKPDDIQRQRDKKNEKRKLAPSKSSQNQNRAASLGERMKSLKVEIKVLESQLKTKKTEFAKLSKLKLNKGK